jgi:hypothetical protein
MFEVVDRILDVSLEKELSLDEVGLLSPGAYRVRMTETLVEIAGLVQKQTAICWLEDTRSPPELPPTRLGVTALATLLAEGRWNGKALCAT